MAVDTPTFPRPRFIAETVTKAAGIADILVEGSATAQQHGVLPATDAIRAKSSFEADQSAEFLAKADAFAPWIYNFGPGAPVPWLMPASI